MELCLVKQLLLKQLELNNQFSWGEKKWKKKTEIRHIKFYMLYFIGNFSTWWLDKDFKEGCSLIKKKKKNLLFWILLLHFTWLEVWYHAPIFLFHLHHLLWCPTIPLYGICILAWFMRALGCWALQQVAARQFWLVEFTAMN